MNKSYQAHPTFKCITAVMDKSGALDKANIESLRVAGNLHIVLEKESPWMENRTIYICSSSDLLLTQNAAEEAIRAIIIGTPPAPNWIQTTHDSELDDKLHDHVESPRLGWEDDKLPLQDLTMYDRMQTCLGRVRQESRDQVKNTQVEYNAIETAIPTNQIAPIFSIRFGGDKTNFSKVNRICDVRLIWKNDWSIPNR